MKDKLLIFDEAHTMRTEIVGKKSGMIVRTAIDVAKKAKKILLLTATPIMNYPHEIGNLIELMDIKRIDINDEHMNEKRFS